MQVWRCQVVSGIYTATANILGKRLKLSLAALCQSYTETSPQPAQLKKLLDSGQTKKKHRRNLSLSCIGITLNFIDKRYTIEDD